MVFTLFTEVHKFSRYSESTQSKSQLPGLFSGGRLSQLLRKFLFPLTLYIYYIKNFLKSQIFSITLSSSTAPYWRFYPLLQPEFLYNRRYWCIYLVDQVHLVRKNADYSNLIHLIISKHFVRGELVLQSPGQRAWTELCVSIPFFVCPKRQASFRLAPLCLYFWVRKQWSPHGESNSGLENENLLSWATRRWGVNHQTRHHHLHHRCH